MTTQQAMNVAAAPLDHSKQAMADALIVLRDALRAAQAQVVKASATEAAYFVARNNLAVAAERIAALEGQVAAMREAAAKVAEHYGDVTRGCETIKPGEAAQTIADAIRALPVPAARTYEDGVRDAAKAARAHYGPTVHNAPEANPYAVGRRDAAERIEALLSPASAPTPGLTAMPIVLPDGSRGWRVGLNGQEATYTDKDGAPHARIDPPPPKAFDAEAAFAELARGLTEHHNLVLHAPTHLNLPPWNLGEAIARARKAGSGS